MKPFLKWVGGKRQLLPILKQFIPNHDRYVELFIGGGALFFSIEPKKAIINDINKELINTYNIVKHYPQELIKDLKKHINTKEYFLQIRALDRDIKKYSKLSSIEKASRFIYLNRTCFNGLYRVNKKGEFNTPFGNYKNPNIIQEEHILNASKILQNTDIYNQSFEKFNIDFFDKNDFIYLDPPYIPINSTSNFKEYSKEGFNISNHIELANFVKKLDQKGIRFLLSNSFTESSLNIFKDFKIKEVYAKRNVASRVSSRATVKEILVYNY